MGYGTKNQSVFRYKDRKKEEKKALIPKQSKSAKMTRMKKSYFITSKERRYDLLTLEKFTAEMVGFGSLEPLGVIRYHHQVDMM